MFLVFASLTGYRKVGSLLKRCNNNPKSIALQYYFVA